MKRKLIVVMLALASFGCLHSFANNDKRTIKQRVAAMTTEQKEARAAEIKSRVEEIQTMDKSSLTSEQRRTLRQELHSINIEAKAIDSGGFYISLGGILIIILVLLIVL